MKTILVTGGNRGIGLEICRQLCLLGHNVIMGSRDPEKGLEAAKNAGLNVHVVALDVTDIKSIIELQEHVGSQFGQLDVLINNAGLGSTHFNRESNMMRVAKDVLRMGGKLGEKIKDIVKPALQRAGISTNTDNVAGIELDQIKMIMETNTYGALSMIQNFIPLLEKSDEARIINISSGMGALDSLDGQYPAYRLSKVALNALTIMFAKELKGKNIAVNALCPGWVRTDMGGPDAPRGVSEGADTAVWLATEKVMETGKFFRDRKIIPW